ncbi:hypothetical protein COV11_04855 [Candidatus Woesearchaeota archaeon CG10_big_fil_rev_8_21_14_0_10_30_7]|nr:MAG: hypothetical protein COV11_04855 [Candidatus Woesearchaeota archaeon CG10_big_fil_rev_8_21_14_0_10_30_7]
MFKMKKVWIFLLLFFVFACNTGSNGNEPFVNFRSGTQGVIFDFVPNQPPYKIYDDERVNVLLQVENRGAYPVGKQLDKIYLSGFDHQLIYPLDNFNGKQIPDLEGKTIDNRGIVGKDYVEFQLGVNPLTSAHYPFKMMATACYGYQSIAETPICIDPNPFSRGSSAKVCVPNSLGLGNQGGPVSVSNVNVEARKGRTSLTFNVQNVGSGDVYKRDSMSHCNPYSGSELDFKDLDFVEVVDVLFVGGESIKGFCKNLVDNNFVRLQNNVGSFTCTVDTDNVGSEQTRVLRVILDYGYRSVLFKDFDLIHVPR